MLLGRLSEDYPIFQDYYIALKDATAEGAYMLLRGALSTALSTYTDFEM